MDQPIYHLEKVLQGKEEEAGDFIGPLDLILHLLSKNKLEIQDISISQILEQYLEWVSKRQELNLELASEFIAMAAHLMYIKSRMLLSSKDEEALTEMELLIASLEERQKQESFERIQLGLSMMEALYQGASNYLETPKKLPEDRPRELLSQNPQDLFSAMERLVLRQHESLPPSVTNFHGLVGQEPYPVEQKAAELYCLISKGGHVSLQQLIWDCRSRSELVAMFLAVLELCRSGQIILSSHEEEVTLSLPQYETAALIAT